MIRPSDLLVVGGLLIDRFPAHALSQGPSVSAGDVSAALFAAGLGRGLDPADSADGAVAGSGAG